MKSLVTPKQVANAIGVSESSLKRWCDRGLIPTVRTGGGHRRLPINGVIDYLRRSEHPISHPELLGLPSATGKTVRVVERAKDDLVEGLLKGNEQLIQQILFDLYLAGHRIAEICDHAISCAFEEIGSRWECGSADVYQERRACEIMSRVLNELRQAIIPPDFNQKAIGGTLNGDQYVIPNGIAELVLRENDWDATSLGTSIPIENLEAAVRDEKPKLFWVSVSYIPDEKQFLDDFPKLTEVCEENDVAFAVGGRVLTESIREQLKYSAFCDTMQHLESFARTLHKPKARNSLGEITG